MLLFEIIAEQRIRDAIANGDFDNLPGAGLPLVFDEEPFVAPEQRMVNHILKRAGLVPSDVSMRKAISQLREKIKHLPQQDDRAELKRRELTYLLLKVEENSFQSIGTSAS